MPQPSYPPYSAGALTIPRMLVRWLDVNAQNGPLTRTMSYVTLPIFNAPVSWAGYSTIVTTFNSEGPNNFSIKASVAPVNPNYTLCISFIEGGVLTRYLLWQATGSVLPYNIPLYSGQPILKNFRFEVWSTSQGNATQSTVIQMYTSVAGQVDYRYGNDFQLVGNDGQQTSFQSITTHTPIPAGYGQKWSPQDMTVGGGNLVSWTDEVNSTILTPTSTTQVTAVAPVVPSVALVVSGAISGVSAGNNPGAVCILFNAVILPAGTQTLYSNGNGITISVNAAHKLLVNGSPSNIALTANTWYILINDVVDGYNWLVLLSTGVQVDFFNGGGGSPDATITIGSAGIAVADVTTYQDNSVALAIAAVVGYYQTNFTTLGMSLPLTFPVGSTSITN